MRLVCVALVGLVTTAYASDHTNLDSGRPLRFTDARPAAFGAREFTMGLAGSSFASGMVPFEMKYGYASNRDISIGIDPVLGRSSRLDSVHLNHFQMIAGETEQSAAFALGFSADMPLDSGQPFGIGVVAVWSQFAGAGTWRHVNLGYQSQGSAVTGVLGFSRQMGYHQTALAELGLSSNEKWIGLGLRRQLALSTVLDLGFEVALGSSRGTVRVGLTQSY